MDDYEWNDPTPDNDPLGTTGKTAMLMLIIIVIAIVMAWLVTR